MQEEKKDTVNVRKGKNWCIVEKNLNIIFGWIWEGGG
jgi:hypothetical protein